LQRCGVCPRRCSFGFSYPFRNHLIMHCLWTAITLFALVLSTGQPARSFNIAFSDSAAPRSIKWPTNRIKIAFSTSLLTPGINIKQGSDVIGAAQRALSRWWQDDRKNEGLL